MSVTIVSAPPKFTPSDNPVIWNVTSSATTNLVGFRFTIMSAAGDVILYQDYNLRPDYPTGTIANLSGVLRNLTNYQLEANRDVLIKPVSKPLFAYKVKISELYYVNGITMTIDEFISPYLSGVLYVWNAWMDTIAYTGFTYPSYVITGTGTPKFLTNTPDKKVVNFNSTNEYLYFLQDGQADLKVVIKTYGTTLLNTYSFNIADLSTNHMYRLSVSPLYLQSYSLVDFTNVASYTIQIMDSGNVAKSELRTYQFKPVECGQEFVNLCWVNNLGGIDSYTFINPQVKYDIARASIQTNTYRNSPGTQGYISNGLFNPSEEIYSSKTTTTYSALSNELTDAESRWLLGLFQSKQVWIELTSLGNYYAPVKITNNTYNAPRNRYTKDNLNRIEFEFQTAEGIQPSISI